MIDADKFNLDYILANSCANYYYEPDFDWSTWDGQWTPDWREFTIETHCILYKVVAKMNDDGKTYTIRSYSSEDC